jgi:hypothetical protein
MRAQANDKYCQHVYRALSEGKTLPYFRDQNLILYRRTSDPSEGPKVVVPVSPREQIIRQNHDPVFAGHQGEKRTLSNLRLSYYWPSMSKDVEKFIRECSSCARMKGERNPQGPLDELPETTGPMEITSVDMCGPYPITRKKNKYLPLLTTLPGIPTLSPYPIRKQRLLLGHWSPKCSRNTGARKCFYRTEELILCQFSFKRCATCSK